MIHKALLLITPFLLFTPNQVVCEINKDTSRIFLTPSLELASFDECLFKNIAQFLHHNSFSDGDFLFEVSPSSDLGILIHSYLSTSTLFNLEIQHETYSETYTCIHASAYHTGQKGEEILSRLKKGIYYGSLKSKNDRESTTKLKKDSEEIKKIIFNSSEFFIFGRNDT